MEGSVCSKTIWFFATLISACISLVFMAGHIYFYFTTDPTVTVTLQKMDAVQFPAVAVCLNPESVSTMMWMKYWQISQDECARTGQRCPSREELRNHQFETLGLDVGNVWNNVTWKPVSMKALVSCTNENMSLCIDGDKEELQTEKTFLTSTQGNCAIIKPAHPVRSNGDTSTLTVMVEWPMDVINAQPKPMNFTVMLQSGDVVSSRQLSMHKHLDSFSTKLELKVKQVSWLNKNGDPCYSDMSEAILDDNSCVNTNPTNSCSIPAFDESTENPPRSLCKTLGEMDSAVRDQNTRMMTSVTSGGCKATKSCNDRIYSIKSATPINKNGGGNGVNGVNDDIFNTRSTMIQLSVSDPSVMKTLKEDYEYSTLSFIRDVGLCVAILLVCIAMLTFQASTTSKSVSITKL